MSIQPQDGELAVLTPLQPLHVQIKLASPLLPLISCVSLRLVLVDEDTHILPLGGASPYMTVEGDIVRVSLPTFSALNRKGIPERVLLRVVGAEVGNPVEPPSAW